MNSLRYFRISFVILLLILATSSASGQSHMDLQQGRAFIHPQGKSVSPTRAALGPQSLETYHNGATLLCSQCHITHASKQHRGQGESGPDPFGGYPQNLGPSRHLLKAPDPVTLCLACHDNQPGIPDVVGSDVNGLAERAAGFFSAPNVANPRGHTLQTGLVAGPDDLCYRCHFAGSFATAAVTCIDCHNPHGNEKVRNLQWASWPGGEPDFGLYVASGASGTAKYEAANTAYGDPGVAGVREVTNMCNDCHHTLTGSYYNDPHSTGIHVLHPSYDSERGDPNNIAHGGTSGASAPAHWEAGTGSGFRSTARVPFVTRLGSSYSTARTVDASTNGVFCLSCHKAHGGERAFGLNWEPVSGIGGEGCDQCHAISGD